MMRSRLEPQWVSTMSKVLAAIINRPSLTKVHTPSYFMGKQGQDCTTPQLQPPPLPPTACLHVLAGLMRLVILIARVSQMGSACIKPGTLLQVLDQGCIQLLKCSRPATCFVNSIGQRRSLSCSIFTRQCACFQTPLVAIRAALQGRVCVGVRDAWKRGSLGILFGCCQCLRRARIRLMLSFLSFFRIVLYAIFHAGLREVTAMCLRHNLQEAREHQVTF